MADINHVTLVGRLTRDAELKYTNSGQAVSNIALAVNQRRRREDQWVDEAHFFDCVVWGRTAEVLNQYLVKGKQVGLVPLWHYHNPTITLGPCWLIFDPMTLLLSTLPSISSHGSGLGIECPLALPYSPVTATYTVVPPSHRFPVLLHPNNVSTTYGWQSLAAS